MALQEEIAEILNEEQYNEVIAVPDRKHQRVEEAPKGREKLGKITIVCLILNRIVGSGIFVTPVYTLNGTGSVGTSLIVWGIGGILATCGLMVWLELGLSTPLLHVPGSREMRPVPRSGGEKNYLEFIYGRGYGNRNGPRNLVTCLYGIPFILLANLSGNCLAFALFFLNATGRSDAEAYKGAIIGIAFVALTLVLTIHVFSRRGGIIINNFFAVLKVGLLIAIVVLGFANSNAETRAKNFSPDQAFLNRKSDLSSYTRSLLFVVYSYMGFEQPFYVLAEARSPRRVFPRYTFLASCIGVVLYILVNIAYFCVVPRDYPGIEDETNMAMVFFRIIFGKDNEMAQRALSGIIALCIFGNILVMTFTASRVKQEVAKEGILPFWTFFATSRRTPWALWKTWRGTRDGQEHDQSPMAALGLHWVASAVLIACTAMLGPQIAYQVLVSLYSYSVIVLNGFVTALGLLMLYIQPARQWRQLRSWTPPGGGLPYAAIYTVAFLFLLVTAFVPPREDSPFGFRATGIRWWVVPAVGLLAVGFGGVWYLLLRLVMVVRGRTLEQTRSPYLLRDQDTGEWVLMAEVVKVHWRVTKASAVWNKP